MKTLGILQNTFNKGSEYIDEVAKICSVNDITVYQFTPFSWNQKTDEVHGYYFNKTTETWEKKTFSLPTYIYDRCFYPTNKELKKKCHTIVIRLKKRAKFIGEGFPNKWKVYQWLIENERLAHYIPTSAILNKESFLSFLIKYRSIALKPIFGAGGQGFYKISYEDGRTLIQSGDNSFSQMFHEQLQDVYEQLHTNHFIEPYLIQPFLPLTKNNVPFDLRVVMQKRSPNVWKMIGMGYRFGKKGTLISNLTSGGHVKKNVHIPKAQKSEFKRMFKTIKEELPKQIEKHHPAVFEIGIDIGIEENGQMWILEVNSKPGYKTILQLSEENKKHFICEGPYKAIEHDVNN
ncbi:YheC/YheD family endospore coat-associated protein [Evansella halocellulosilytica]|uniref:YheC/YheD family endospore coat-associated protein n=1 Tax=Evansella halocellulosilytica TaxID=2011013 RepID=UPI0015C9FE35|nr:YheC/YheD family protein [Evansella halocellulosilytica]